MALGDSAVGIKKKKKGSCSCTTAFPYILMGFFLVKILAMFRVSIISQASCIYSLIYIGCAYAVLFLRAVHIDVNTQSLWTGKLGVPADI